MLLYCYTLDLDPISVSRLGDDRNSFPSIDPSNHPDYASNLKHQLLEGRKFEVFTLGEIFGRRFERGLGNLGEEFFRFSQVHGSDHLSVL